jgi:hypothetical protein
MRDVVARCEEGIAAQVISHNKQMAKMTMTLESMQDMVNVMEAAHDKQQDALSKRDAQIDKLKQELSNAKANLMMRPSKMPMGPSSSTSSTTTSKKPVSASNKKAALSLDNLAPAIFLATQKIADAISNGLQLDNNNNNNNNHNEVDDDYDMLSSSSTDQLPNTVNISKAINSVIQEAILSSSSSTTNNMNQEIDCDTTAITNAVQIAVQNAAIEASSITASSSSVVSSSEYSNSSSNGFTPIHEAVSFVQSTTNSYIMESAVFIEESEKAAEEALPTLIHEQGFKSTEHDSPSCVSSSSFSFSDTDDEDSIDQEEFSSMEELVQHVMDKDKIIFNRNDCHNKEPLKSQHYEPYSASIKQSFILPTILNRWTLFAAVVYILSQYQVL